MKDVPAEEAIQFSILVHSDGPSQGRAQRPHRAPGSTITLVWEVSEAVNVLTAFSDAPSQVKKSCKKRKIAFVAEIGIKVQIWWNQSGRSRRFVASCRVSLLLLLLLSAPLRAFSRAHKGPHLPRTTKYAWA